MNIKFTKMHGAGNDYIYVNTFKYKVADPEAAAIAWSRYHTGIGSDGLVLIGAPSTGTDADFSMRIFNNDGSEAMMCGNASRCIGKYVHDKGLTTKLTIRLETLSGIKTIKLHLAADGTVDGATVDMGEPTLHCASQFDEARGQLPTAGGLTFRGTFVSMGNPHYVTFIDDIRDASGRQAVATMDDLDLTAFGKLLERDEAFPQRCNIEFAQVVAAGKVRTRVWERGSGITQACGTGACATAVAALLTGRSGTRSSIVMDGGTLDISIQPDHHVLMTGPAAIAFEGEVAEP